MSIRLMSLVWDVEFPTATQMLVALKLADYANDDGASIFPANSTLAAKARCSESTVKVTLKALRSAGILRLVRQGGNGPKDTNEWSLNVSMLIALAKGEATISGCSDVIEIDGYMDELPLDFKGSTKGSNSDPLVSTRGQTGALRGQPAGSKGSAGRPQSINNHHKDSSDAQERASDECARAPCALPAITVEHGTAAHSAWVEHLVATGRASVAKEARQGTIIVSARWPTSDAQFHGMARRTTA